MQTERLPLAAQSPAYFDALNRGAYAFLDAVCFADCPFPAGDLREAWQEGWRNAQDCAESVLLAEAL